MATGTSVTRDAERGQVLVMTAMALLALCAVLGLAFDAGFLFDDRRRAQTAADAAALAGAEQLRRGSNGGLVTAAANNDGTTLNGFTNGTNGTEVVINNPPSSGYYVGDPSFVEAIVTRSRANLFMGLVGYQTGTVRARAVAGVKDSTNCIYALDQTARIGLNVSSSGGGLNAGCGLVVDSNSGTALNCGSTANVTASSIAVTGGNTGCVGPATPQTNIPPEPDPLATRTDPCTLGYLQGGCTTCSGCCDYQTTMVNGVTTTLGPGVYCGGITVGPSANVTFLPGTYVLMGDKTGGGLTVKGNSTVQGNGVTFYNTATAAKNFQPFSVTGGTVGSLSAPTSGPMESMLFFQDRTFTANVTNTVAGGSTLNTEGVLYFPTEALNFAGNSSGTANYTILVAATINITGNSVLNANLSSLQDGNPIKKIALAE